MNNVPKTRNAHPRCHSAAANWLVSEIAMSSSTSLTTLRIGFVSVSGSTVAAAKMPTLRDGTCASGTYIVSVTSPAAGATARFGTMPTIVANGTAGSMPNLICRPSASSPA